MPILNIDFKSLEWRNILELSKDKVGIDEVLNGIDIHSTNVNRFKLPSRLIAKIFLFRWIYLGSAYAYSVDPEFAGVETGKLKRQHFWQSVIDAANEKYYGIANWHKETVNHVMRHGVYESPLTGRSYPFSPKERRGELVWPDSEIVNLPVQGLGADIVALCRSEYYKLYGNRNGNVLPILTVHDSLTFDCKYDAWYDTYLSVKEIVREQLPELWERKYGDRLIVPHDVEAEVGINYSWMHKMQ